MASPFLTGTLTVKIGRRATLPKKRPEKEARKRGKAVASPWMRAGRQARRRLCRDVPHGTRVLYDLAPVGADQSDVTGPRPECLLGLLVEIHIVLVEEGARGGEAVISRSTSALSARAVSKRRALEACTDCAYRLSTKAV